MQIVNPLRTALPYITLQTAKVQRCWADYFIFRGFAGGGGRVGGAPTPPRTPPPPPPRAGGGGPAETRRRSLRQPPQAAGPAAPAPDFLQALKNLIKNPLTLLQIIPRWYIILP